MHEGEAPSKFKRRRHCNSECSKTNPLRHVERSEEIEKNRLQEKKTCSICSGRFTRHKHESRPAFEKRPTCSRTCAGKKRSQDNLEENLKHPRVCENKECGKTFYRHGGVESWEKFKARKTCSEDCGHANRRKDGWKEKKTVTLRDGVGKLPPITPLARHIPEAPQLTEVEVWRPESWGGPYKRKVS